MEHKSARKGPCFLGILTAMVIPNIGAFIARVLSLHYLFQPDGCQMKAFRQNCRPDDYLFTAGDIYWFYR